MKHSPSDIEVVVDNLLLPAPKRNGGKSECRDGNVLVENPLARLREGLINELLLRLNDKLACLNWNA